MDAAASRTIRIGKSTIDLIDLDVALNKAAAQHLAEEKAVSAVTTYRQWLSKRSIK